MMDEQKNINKHSNLIRDILFVIRRNIILMLAVITFVSGLGVGYSYIRKPNYIASHTVNFTISGPDTKEKINAIIQYVGTVVDFCDEGVVLDRANFYYKYWVDNKEDYDDIEEFFETYKKVSKPEDNNELFYRYHRETTLPAERFLVASAVSTKTIKNGEMYNWVYDIRYTDKNKQDAKEKNFVLVLAYMHEIYDGGNEGGQATSNPYFSIDAVITSLNHVGITEDISQSSIIIIAFVLGVALSLLVVYLKNLLDNTVKDKEDLERLTGVAVLGFITDRKEETNGK